VNGDRYSRTDASSSAIEKFCLLLFCAALLAIENPVFTWNLAASIQALRGNCKENGAIVLMRVIASKSFFQPKF
jgi:hypothetical protein